MVADSAGQGCHRKEGNSGLQERHQRVPTVKHAIGLLYLSTALVGFYWSIYLTLTGLYGLPFSSWYAVVFVGAVLLLIGTILWWVSNNGWTLWLPIVGSFCLAAYFIPAVIVVTWQGRLDLIRILIAALVLTSLTVAVRQQQVAAHAHRR